MSSEAPPTPPRLVSQVNNHPWFDDDNSFVTQVWETSSHEVSEQVAGMMNADGWSIYLVANCGTPSIVVYRKVMPDEDRIETCGMCSGHGTLTDDESESQCPHCDGSGYE